ncbi:hypothetical protein SERLA73DRAFT_76872 [Serpula lacrymans var. lacrymans S7.3]|uniref:Uncharacterized protein n=1 Tax=Serpula lacrymans var. lacrymans (strain S7.3) TaxID=936435 RepID=F8Q8C4_SERL3|nr:hypothetical protein SERLA73DRAFT_76872 [Serpula lacrymans var. lacrymans S7.3]
MPPPPPPPPPISRSASAAYSNSLTGYTSSHATYAHHLTIRAALHYLKVKGKSGTELVGNIERDISVSLAITACQLHLTIIDNLQLLWADWSVNCNLSLESLKMHKAPKLLLYDPHMPFKGTEKLVLHNSFFHIAGKDPTPRFAPNLKVSIILVMTNAQFEDILSWKQECKRGVGGSIASVHAQHDSDEEDLEEDELPGDYNLMDECLVKNVAFLVLVEVLARAEVQLVVEVQVLMKVQVLVENQTQACH